MVDMDQLVQNKMKYTNPILNADYSDPDIIKVNGGYYLASSSFNYVPGVPILYSKDLVHYKIVSYVIKKLPSFYNKVRSSNGVWAPSLNYHNNMFYCFIPFPDKGIYYSTCKNPLKDEWSSLKPLLKGKGYEDPTVLFENDKAYLIFGFVKSRIGFNSKLGLVEFDSSLSNRLTKGYKIIYDGNDSTKTIEGPKIYKINSLYYIFAPAFGVEHGKQLVLRSESIYGPYSYQIVLQEKENDNVYGPHQGGLVHLKNDDYAFIHFVFDENLGRIVYLEPCKYNRKTKWFTMGDSNKNPVKKGYLDSKEYPNYCIDYNDNFSSNKLKLIWQTPANPPSIFTKPTKNGLILYTQHNLKPKCIRNYPFVLTSKFSSSNFESILKFDISKLKNNCSFGFTLIGEKYMYILLTQVDENTIVSFYTNDFTSKDVLEKEIIFSKIVESKIKLDYSNNGQFKISLLNQYEDCYYSYNARKEHYIGLRIGMFTFGRDNKNSYVKLLDYTIKEK